MAQDIKTVNQLIINALYLTGELAPGETPDAFMLSSGLELINELLAKYTADSIYIPYLSEVSFTMVAGQATYSLSELQTPAPDINSDLIVDLSFANFTLSSSGQSIIYPIRIINKAQYYTITRLSPFSTLPGFCFLDKQPLISYVTFYPAPDQAYPCQLGVKLMLDSVVAQQELSSIPPFYYGFLKYSLARKFISVYPSANWSQTAEDEYQNYVTLIKNANETDLTIRPSAILTSPDPFYWQNILAY